jgi:hypothetical protein
VWLIYFGGVVDISLPARCFGTRCVQSEHAWELFVGSSRLNSPSG